MRSRRSQCDYVSDVASAVAGVVRSRASAHTVGKPRHHTTRPAALDPIASDSFRGHDGVRVEVLRATNLLVEDDDALVPVKAADGLVRKLGDHPGGALDGRTRCDATDAGTGLIAATGGMTNRT